MMARGGALAVLILLAFAVPVRAAEPPPEDVMAAFDQLLGEPGQRLLLGLPRDRTWRASGKIPVTVFAEQPGKPAWSLRAAGQALEAATGVTVDLVAKRPFADLDRDQAFGLRVAIGARPDLVARAARLGIEAGLRERLESGESPSAFAFARRGGLIGRVLIAEDEAPAALETALVRSLIWALGGVALGQEEAELIDLSDVAPALSLLGRSVLALLYHRDMAAGLPLDEARARARRILGLEQ